MVFALYDYVQYRRKRGRYIRDINKSGSFMGRGFDGSIPNELITLLKAGDIICVQSFDWWLSWFIMYLTSSSISHVAQYLGNGQIAHMGLDGLAIEPVERLFRPQARFLPVIWFFTPEERAKIPGAVNSLKDDVYYDTRILLRKGLRILSGRAWQSYRWKFLLDIGFFILILDTLLYVALKSHVLLWLIPICLTILLLNWLRWLKRPVRTEDPEELINWLFRTGRGMPLLDIHLSRILSRKNSSS